MNNNNIHKDIIGIAFSGQSLENLKVTYYCKFFENSSISKFKAKNIMLSLESIKREFLLSKYGESISTENLILVLKE